MVSMSMTVMSLKPTTEEERRGRVGQTIRSGTAQPTLQLAIPYRKLKKEEGRTHSEVTEDLATQSSSSNDEDLACLSEERFDLKGWAERARAESRVVGPRQHESRSCSTS